MSTYQTFSLTTDYSLNGLHWRAANPKGSLIIIHGQGEYAGRYQHVAEYFGQKGWQTWAADLPGHGHSSGKRGHVNDLEEYVSVVKALIAHAHSNHPGLPVLLYGHSLGGLIVLVYLLKNNDLPIAGAIVTSPFIQLAEEPPAWLVAAGKLAVKVYPSGLQPNRLKLEYLCSDPAVIEAYQKDPLVHGKVSFAAAMSMLEHTQWVNQYQGTVRKPLLIMHGMKDGITKPLSSQAFAERVEGPITWKPWPDLYHEIQNGLKKEEVLATMSQWIDNL